MGQYICVGILHKVKVSKSELDEFQKEFSHENLLSYFEKTHHITDAFERKETEEEYIYQLKDSVIEKELIHFLKAFYPIRYEDDQDYNRTLKAIGACKGVQELRNFLETYDEYDGTFKPIERTNFCFLNSTDFDNRHFFYHSQSVSLSMDGKILMECSGGFTSFVRRCLNELFQKYKIADSIRVWIDG